MTPLRVDTIHRTSRGLLLPRARLDAVLCCLEDCAALGFDLANPVDLLPENRYGLRYATFTEAPGQRLFLRSDCGPFNIMPARLPGARGRRSGAPAWRGLVSFGNGLTRAQDGGFVELKSLLLGQVDGPAELRDGAFASARGVLEQHGFVLRTERRAGDGLAFSACLHEEASACVVSSPSPGRSPT